jgi:ATP-dependent Clp protease ATP-binding subunit ClpA
MMTDRFSGEARQVVYRAQEQARRLGQPFIGCEHLLYGLASAEGAVGVLLRDRGVTAERVEEVFIQLVGAEHGGGGQLLGGLDRDALADIGIDLDGIRQRVEATFGPSALAPRMRRRRRWLSGRCAVPPTGHLRPTRRAQACIDLSVREARRARDEMPGVEHLALALLSVNDGLPARILAVIGAPAPGLRAAIVGLGS